MRRASEVGSCYCKTIIDRGRVVRGRERVVDSDSLGLDDLILSFVFGGGLSYFSDLTMQHLITALTLRLSERDVVSLGRIGVEKQYRDQYGSDVTLYRSVITASTTQVERYQEEESEQMNCVM